LLLPGIAAAQLDVLNSRESLKGLTHITVLIEEIPEVEGLDRTLRTEVELKLRQSGITVPDEEPGQAYALLPRLYVNLNLMMVSESPTFVYSLNIAFYRTLRVPGGADSDMRFIHASTWTKGMVGIKPARTIRDIKGQVHELLAEFLNDYLAVNPKK
jgi:hypothetical protein